MDLYSTGDYTERAAKSLAEVHATSAASPISAQSVLSELDNRLNGENFLKSFDKQVRKKVQQILTWSSLTRAFKNWSASLSDDDCEIATMETISEEFAPIDGRKIRPKPIPPPLILSGDFNSLLTEFAIIATSPRSPLMQKHLPIRKRALSCSSMEAVYSPAPTTGVYSPAQSTTPLSTTTEEMEAPEPSPCPASPIGTTAVNCIKNETRSNDWSAPVPVWHCFLKGTKIFLTVNSSSWKYAEDVVFQETKRRKVGNEIFSEYSAPYGLKLVEKLCIVSEKSVRLRFRPISCDGDNGSVKSKAQSDLVVECNLDHPFYAKEKGWSSIQPQITLKQYGMSCRMLEVNDICLPSSHQVASYSPDIFESISSFDFTPEDKSAVAALSDMANRKHSRIRSISGNLSAAISQSPAKKYVAEGANNKSKRPMNGFMLFAKQQRVQYTQLYPGKDNRAISVILGETWKEMSEDERNSYAETARALAEEQKKLFPDCWKRRRSLSTSS
ncbi:HMG box-containing protein 1 [Chamberlinius hualienensis]